MFRLLCLSCLVTLSLGAALPRFPPRPIFHGGRIVGGIDTDISEVPWQLAIEWDGYQFCAASIISENFALSAGHCIEEWSAGELTVRTGSSLRQTGGKLLKVKTLYRNENFTMRVLDYDVSLLELAEPIQFDKNSQPIPLADEEPAAGTVVLVSGWGRIADGEPPSDQLQSVKVPIVDRQLCEEEYADPQFPRVTSRMICGGVEGKDACNGDSGGAIVVNGTAVGIVSWSLSCALADYPGVYTNIADPAIRQFIRDNSGL